MLVATAQVLKDLKKVQADINSRVTYRTDSELYHKEEFWEIADNAGDCEDFALRKRQELIALGYPANELRLAICLDETGAGHAVLTVDLAATPKQAAVTYVLDNRYPELRRASGLRAAGYKFLMRQAADGNYWVETK